MANRLVWGRDLYKGFKLPQKGSITGNIDDLTPFQMLDLESKTEDWVHAVADYYETVGWQNVERKAGRIQKNFMMRQGKLDMSDYIVNPEINPFHQAVGMFVPPSNQSPLEQFYPLAPKFVDLLKGEFIKRDNTWTVEAIDPDSKAMMFAQKEEGFRQGLMQQALLQKRQTLGELGITEEADPEAFAQEMQAITEHLTNVELKSKTFRTSGIEWVEKVLKIHEKRYNLSELEPDAFDVGLTTDREFWHLDLLDDDFKLELLNTMWCDYHKAPNKKYVSDGDYFLWFDWMSTGDVVNSYGRRMKEEDLLKLKDIYVKTANLVVPDYKKSYQDGYYDYSKNWLEATNLDPKMNDALLGQELAYNFTRSPNFEHNLDVDILNPMWDRYKTGKPQMFRVMRLYWRSLRRVGWLTKINRDGSLAQPPQWIDENYRVTVEPEYDKSIAKKETADNLLYGEHIEWSWATEWRHVIKISPNQKHNFWLNNDNQLSSIYIDGAPVKFQFKGAMNPFDSLPPVEGCEYSYLNVGPHSFVDSIRPFQIMYNIAMNKVPKKFLADKGNKVVLDQRLLNTNHNDVQANGLDPLEGYQDMLDNSDFLTYRPTREGLEGAGQAALPQVLQLSTAQEAQMYLQIADGIKWMAGENVGISRQRMGGQKASDTAYSVEQGINYSVTQTETLFEQHANLMQRVRQRMVDATQFYSTFNESNRDYYINEQHENMFLDIEGMENLTAHYNIYLTSKANTRAALQKISSFLEQENTLSIPISAKARALVEQSLPRIESLLKEGEAQLAMDKEAQRQHEMQIEQQRTQTALAQQQQANEFLASQNDARNAKDIEVARIRAMGGMQTDVDANSVPDSQDNLGHYIKQQEISTKSRDANAAANMKRQTELDKNMVQREKNQTELQKEKLKGEYALKVAKENTVGEKPKKSKD